MFKSFFTLIFSSLLLFQTAIYAEESLDTNEETIIEDVIPTEEIEQNEPEVEAQKEIQEEISEAQKEADAAEAAELQEVGTGEEPVED